MNKTVAIITIIVLLLLGVGGYYYWQTQKAAPPSEKKTQETSESTSPTNTPTPEEVDKSKYTIEIQNGSGIEGEAGRAQKLLEDDEFTVDSTANADNYDYKDTVIQAGSDVSKEWIDALKTTLEQNYTVQTKVENVPTDASTDVVVVVGSLDDSGKSMAPEETKDEKLTPTEAEAKSTTPTVSVTPSPTEAP